MGVWILICVIHGLQRCVRMGVDFLYNHVSARRLLLISDSAEPAPIVSGPCSPLRELDCEMQDDRRARTIRDSLFLLFVSLPPATQVGW
jgi:hypothetical protein